LGAQAGSEEPHGDKNENEEGALMATAESPGLEEGKRRLLLIDDDRKLCRLLRDYLEPMGYAVEVVHDGPAGVAAAVEGDWHAVILDVMLPGLDGFEVLKRIRARTEVPVMRGAAVAASWGRMARPIYPTVRSFCWRGRRRSCGGVGREGD